MMEVTTYSMWQKFRNCRMACKLRYIDNLVPLEKDPNLSFGSVIHNCLESWYRHNDLGRVYELIDLSYPNYKWNEQQRTHRNQAWAMMTAYVEEYPSEDFEVVELEKTFQGLIINPATGAPSKSFILAGKVDGIIRKNGQYFLMEHKTASQINASYLERLWTDFQITLYSWYIRKYLGFPIKGVLYNILAKTKLKQGVGETEAEFEERKTFLLSQSKTGKTTAKRKMSETDEAFQGRLVEKHRETGMFHREQLYISTDQFEELQAELWELTKAFLDARRRGVFYRNTGYCFQYNRPCSYFPICSSGGNPNVIENYFEKVEPHEELQEKNVTADKN